MEDGRRHTSAPSGPRLPRGPNKPRQLGGARYGRHGMPPQLTGVGVTPFSMFATTAEALVTVHLAAGASAAARMADTVPFGTITGFVVVSVAARCVGWGRGKTQG